MSTEFPSLDELLAEEASLRLDTSRFELFDFADHCVQSMKAENLPLSMIIRLHGRTVYQVALPGSQPIHDMWMLRKARVAELWGHSSLFVRLEHEATSRPYESHGLNLEEFAFFGGGYPLVDEQQRTFGAIGISGTYQLPEHRLLVRLLGEYKSQY